MKRYTIKTLGCKVNQFETEAIGLMLEKEGWQKSSGKEGADLCIINTCTVTGKASVQSRQAIKSIIRKNPGAQVIVTGCYAQTEASEIQKIEGVHSIISHSEKHRIPEMVAGQEDLPEISADCDSSCTVTEFSQFDIDVSGTRTRPFLKIQDGCNSFCTYCIVPHTRGRSRSLPADMVLKRLSTLGEQGHKEVVLTGIHIGRWGEDLSPKQEIFNLLERIDTEKPVSRIRMSSIEPFEITSDIIRLVANSDTFCNHFHIPLQSGDNTILKRMNRPYTAEFFKEIITDIHQAIPDVAIGADILTGFPGETNEEFENTCNLLRSLPMTYLHVFPFSPRKGTPAATLPDQVTEAVKKERTSILREIATEKHDSFLTSLIGKTVEVLVEKQREKSTGQLKGLSTNYIPIHISGPDSYQNRLIPVTITDVREGTVFGEPAD